MPKLIFILTGLLMLVFACQKDPVIEQNPAEPIHFLDPYMGTYEGTLEYDLHDISYYGTWDLQCSQNIASLEDTSYQIQTSVTVSRDSGFVITVNEPTDVLDRTFEMDSTLYHMYSDLIGGAPVAYYYHYDFVSGTDSFYMHREHIINGYNCQWKNENHRFALKKIQ